MPKGTEPTMGLLIQVLENDPELALIMGVDTPTVYLESVPSPFTYPFMVLVESKESENERNSETIGGEQSYFAEFRRVQVASCSNSGDMAWKMIERFRKKFVDENRGIAIEGSGNDSENDPFDISCIPETIQKIQNTHVKDESAREIWSSLQEFTFCTTKLGSN